ncbi:unnamed protein product [Notodromas monacha]|uniref:XRN2-binding (XTBD) domain-containing protein n=1 Tax=Notodromas monacha TaxID=399045 RepID=A0A7R9GH20_9CRUS|nr:unnamed protein product [Notodromas monacha]CAG0921015.1 unnamed protein product [Notodromas monacha]
MFDISEYKSKYDPEAHWELKKAFFERYMGEVPESELVCLAQTFINVEILGCTYPEETMKKLAEMREGIQDAIDEFERLKKNRAQKIMVGSHSRYKKDDQAKAMQEAKQGYQTRSGNPWEAKRQRVEEQEDRPKRKHF